MKRNSSDGKQERPQASHGGDLARAMAIYGGQTGDWLDLSTGVNACAYPITPPPPSAPVWTRLPDAAVSSTAAEAARQAYAAPAEAAVTPTPGAQGAIQLLPRLLLEETEAQPLVAIIGPTYAEHAAAFAAAGWWVEEVQNLRQAEGAAAAVVVNPNNPDGGRHDRDALSRLRDRVGHLIIDESFMDETPERSMAKACGGEDLTVLRSLGKFYGLAGLRLGFAITGPRLGARLSRALGPWPVSGPALHLGAEALLDADWAQRTRESLAVSGPRLRALGLDAGLEPQGGTGLFHSFIAPDAADLQAALAERRIWTRIWNERPGWIRFGAPGTEEDWLRLAAALQDLAP